MEHRLFVFLGLAWLLTITPGPDMALVLRNALGGGFAAGVRTSAGIISGLCLWAAASAAGIAALLAASATAFTVLKLVGAAYLVTIGIASLLRSRRAQALRARRPPARGGLFRQGLLTNLLNPKIGVFYTTFLPQFISPGRSAVAWTFALAAIHIGTGVVWLTFYSWLVTRAREALTAPRLRRMLDRITGTVLVGFGLRLALERR